MEVKKIKMVVIAAWLKPYSLVYLDFSNLHESHTVQGFFDISVVINTT